MGTPPPGNAKTQFLHQPFQAIYPLSSFLDRGVTEAAHASAGSWILNLKKEAKLNPGLPGGLPLTETAEMWPWCGEGPGWADELPWGDGLPSFCILPSPGETALEPPARLAVTHLSLNPFG